MARAKRVAAVGKGCVACGSCVKVCPRGAIEVFRGVIARVNSDRCLGCGMCEKTCPAGIIVIQEREEA